MKKNPNPLRRALKRWKAANPGKNNPDFAALLGYSVDPLYRLMRDPPAAGPVTEKAELLVLIAELAGMTVGAVTRYFAGKGGGE